MAEATRNAGRFTARLRETSPRRLARTAGFYLSVLVFVCFWLLAFDFVLYAGIVGWFDPVLSDTIHFVHDIALASWVWVWGLAMVAQLYRPANRVTAMQVALLVSVTDLGVGLVGGAFDPSALLFFGPIFAAAALHPARGQLLDVRGFSRDDVDPVLLGLVALAVVPVVLHVASQWSFQQIRTGEHAALDHYATMSYHGLSVLALGALASLRNRGRRFAAYGAGLLAATLGVASVFQPTMSALGPLWAGLAILWALALVGASEWSVRTEATRTAVRSREEPEPRASP
jgi:hypothetical protein